MWNHIRKLFQKSADQNPFGFSPRVLAALHDAGWNPNRDNTAITEKYAHLLGAKWIPVAGPFVRSFGDLSISHTLWVWKEPISDDELTRLQGKITKIVESNVVAVASSNYMGDNCTIWIDEKGRIYAVDSEGMVFAGDNIASALEVLLFGAPPPSAPPELRDSLERAYQWNDIKSNAEQNS